MNRAFLRIAEFIRLRYFSAAQGTYLPTSEYHNSPNVTSPTNATALTTAELNGVFSGPIDPVGAIDLLSLAVVVASQRGSRPAEISHWPGEQTWLSSNSEVPCLQQEAWIRQ